MAHPKGGYRTAENKRVPGVTTIIGRFKDSGGLLYWAFAQGQSAERGEITRLYDKRDEAATAGTLAHSMVEASILGNAVDDVLKGATREIKAQAEQAFRSYQKWESMTNLHIIDQEMSLVSEKYGFGGTPDAIGEVNGELCLVDWKTSNKVYPDMMIQLAAYRQLIHECTDYVTTGFHLCRFSKQHADFTHHYWSELDDAWEQFQLFLRAYEIDKALKKRVG